MKKCILSATASLCAMLLSSCAGTSENAVKPTLALEWFTSYDDAKASMNSYTLLKERESEGAVKQLMQDYENVKLFGYNCDLTLCFTDSGLIGFNYHDVQRNQNYKDWYQTLESTYGLPTEESSGMVSWYDNPAGKDTAVYLFNLEEGVQVSIYATADSPDKSYEKEIVVPAPEIRTPIVPVNENSSRRLRADEENASTAPAINPSSILGMNADHNYIIAVTDPVGEIVTDRAGETVTTVIPAEVITTDKDGKTNSTSIDPTIATTTVTTDSKSDTKVAEKSTEPPADHTRSFLQGGLSFYSGPDSERRKMSDYTQLYEYRTEEPGQPWELIMEYENVPYEGKNCNGVLCFTSLGLVGVNYFDSNTSDYTYWVQTLTGIYGSPNETQSDYAVWSYSPVGNGTMIYVFALEDGVQISFFTDDTGSELA